jgi:hypothetical protein
MALDSSWTEPVIVDTNNQPTYPYNHIQQSESGHSIEMDDTPGRERVRLQHRSKTFLEMQPNGDEVHKIYGDGYEIIAGAKNVSIKGQCNITIEGGCVVHIKGDSVTHIEGNVQQVVNGNLDQIVKGTTDITSSGDINMISQGNINLTAQTLNVNADFNIRGDITATNSISAVGNVTAGKQLYAGAGVLTPAFIQAGSPVATTTTPGWITGIVVQDAVRTTIADRAIYDSHTHPAVKGGPDTTAPPTQQQ